MFVQKLIKALQHVCLSFLFKKLVLSNIPLEQKKQQSATWLIIEKCKKNQLFLTYAVLSCICNEQKVKKNLLRSLVEIKELLL